MAEWYTVRLTRQQLEDVLSAVSFTEREYPPAGSDNFRASLERIQKKLWKVIRGKPDGSRNRSTD